MNLAVARRSAAWDRLSQSCVTGEHAKTWRHLKSRGINGISWHVTCSYGLREALRHSRDARDLMRLAAPQCHVGTAVPRRYDHPEYHNCSWKCHCLLGRLHCSVIYTHYQIQVSEQLKGTPRNSVEVM